MDNYTGKRKQRRSYKRKKQLLLLNFFTCSLVLIGLGIISFHLFGNDFKDKNSLTSNNHTETPKLPSPTKPGTSVESPKEEKSILISAAGDCILGRDSKLNYDNSLPAMWINQQKDYSYFFSNVKDIFTGDDYSIVNLENPLTDSEVKADKGDGLVFHFKGPKDFVNILTSSSVEGVTIANNHIYDYGVEGFNDTVETLKNANVDFCGNGYTILKDIKGVKFGFLGYTGWSNSQKLKDTIKTDIENLRAQGAKIVIPYFHWGIEREYEPYDVQIDLAHFAIDNGADLVLGSHPHVIQSLESYKGKLIAYSFGNFSFGGNSNPKDKRTFILQGKFNFTDNMFKNYEVKIIPTSISSVDYKNDYKPTPMEGDKKAELLKTLNELSPTLNNKIVDEFFLLD